MKTHLWSARLHKWLALIVGVQVALWVVSGLFMTLYPIERVRGEHLTRAPAPPVLGAPAVLPDDAGLDVASFRLAQYGGRPVVVAEADGTRTLHDAYTGERIAAPDEARIRELAREAYLGEGDVASVRRIETDAPIEYRGALPVWQVVFDGSQALHLYLDVGSGEIVARRTRLWRIYDVMWMLHIMDYDERVDFNNPLVRIASALAVVVALSGLVLLPYRLLRGGFRRRLRRPARA